MSTFRGFTLVELLITISIIAILSAIGLMAYSMVLKQGRDARRISDLRLIQSALNQYNIDQGFYPQRFGGGTRYYCSVSYYNGYLILIARGSNCPLKSPNGLKTYINEVPKDTSGLQYCYKPLKSGQSCSIDTITCSNTGAVADRCISYCLLANLDSQPAGSDRCDGTSTRTYNFKVTPP